MGEPCKDTDRHVTTLVYYSLAAYIPATSTLATAEEALILQGLGLLLFQN